MNFRGFFLLRFSDCFYLPGKKWIKKKYLKEAYVIGTIHLIVSMVVFVYIRISNRHFIVKEIRYRLCHHFAVAQQRDQQVCRKVHDGKSFDGFRFAVHETGANEVFDETLTVHVGHSAAVV